MGKRRVGGREKVDSHLLTSHSCDFSSSEELILHRDEPSALHTDALTQEFLRCTIRTP